MVNDPFSPEELPTAPPARKSYQLMHLLPGILFGAIGFASDLLNDFSMAGMKTVIVVAVAFFTIMGLVLIIVVTRNNEERRPVFYVIWRITALTCANCAAALASYMVPLLVAVTIMR